MKKEKERERTILIFLSYWMNGRNDCLAIINYRQKIFMQNFGVSNLNEKIMTQMGILTQSQIIILWSSVVSFDIRSEIFADPKNQKGYRMCAKWYVKCF